jgi:hypothetical protein
MQKLSFVRQFEKYSPKVNVGAGADTLTLFLDFPVVLQDIQGAKKRLRYDEVLVKGESYIAKIQTEDLMGNVFSITDTWTTKDGLIQIDREVTYSEVKKETAVRLTTEFDLMTMDLLFLVLCIIKMIQIMMELTTIWLRSIRIIRMIEILLCR